MSVDDWVTIIKATGAALGVLAVSVISVLMPVLMRRVGKVDDKVDAVDVKVDAVQTTVNGSHTELVNRVGQLTASMTAGGMPVPAAPPTPAPGVHQQEGANSHD